MSILLGKNIKFYKISLYCIAFFAFFLISLFTFTSKVQATTYYPTLAGANSADASNNPRRVAISGNYAYVAESNTSGANSLMIYNISNPASPTLVGANSADASAQPRDIAVSGNYAYVAENTGGAYSLMIYNISNPASPTLVGHNTADASSNPQSIAISGNYAYLAEYQSGANSLMIYNISNPALPTLVGHNTADASVQARIVAVSGNYAYVGESTSGANSLMIYNISNPALPTLVGHNTADSSNNPSGINIIGNYAYLSEGNSGANSLMIYNISNPALPTLAGANPSDSSGTGLNIKVSGKYAYTTHWTTGANSLMIYDISNLSSISLVGGNSADASIQPWGVSISGNFVYIPQSQSGANSLMIYDISDIGSATVPINYQGRLTNSSGGLLGNGNTYKVLFCIYTNSSGGTNCTASGTTVTLNSAVYGEVYTSLTPVNGVFNIQLGSGGNGSAGTFPNTIINAGIPYYIGVSAATSGGSYDSEMTPRQQLIANSYAQNSGLLDGYTASQSPIAGQIPVLDSNGYLNLSGTNPQINASGSNTLTLQGSGQTGNIQFFNGNNFISSAGNINLSGSDNVLSGGPVTTSNYGILSIGNGGFAGGGGSNFAGNANGTLLAVNMASTSTSDFLNIQNGSSETLWVDAWGDLYSYATGGFFGDAANSTSKYATLMLGSNPGGNSWGATGSGAFNGSAGGTLIASDVKTAFTGNLADFQVAGNSYFSINYQGNITLVGTITQTFSGTTSSANTENLTGQGTNASGLKINQNPTYTSNATNSGKLLNLTRSLTASGASTTLAFNSTLAFISDNCTTVSSGTCNDTAMLLGLYQNDTSSSGLNTHLIQDTGQGTALDIEQQPTYTSSVQFSGNFNGLDNYISLNSYNSSFNLTSSTSEESISSWISTTANSGVVFSLRNTGNGNPLIDICIADCGGGNPGNGVVNLLVRDGSGVGLKRTDASVTINDGKWHHIVVVRNSSKNDYVYIDGKLVGSGSDTMANPSTFNTLYIGDEVLNASENFNGQINNVRVYNIGLTASNVTSLYNTNYSQYDSTNMIGYWKISEGSGTTVNDSSGYSNTATWHGTFGSQWFSSSVYTNLFNISRSPTSSGGSTTVTNSASLMVVSNNCITSGGTCTDNATVLYMSQNNLASTGEVERINNNSTKTGLSIQETPTYTTTTTIASTLLNINRNLTNSGATVTDAGTLLGLSNNCTITSGTCSDGANVLSLNQNDAIATGVIVSISNSGSGKDIADSTNWSISKTGVITTASTSTAALNFTGASSGITFTNGGSINTTTGNITFQPATSSTTALVHIGLGSGSGTPDMLALDIKNTVGDPAGTVGAMYYNTTTNTFRCYNNTVWASCIGNLAWSAITNPAGAMAISNGVNLTNFSFTSNSGTNGSNNMFSLTDSSAGSSGTGYLFSLTTAASSVLSPFSVVSQSGNSIYIGSTGNVGINTISPTTTLSVVGNMNNINTSTAYSPPKLITNSVSLGGTGSSPYDITTVGKYLYVANNDSTNGNISILDISNPAVPVLMSNTAVGTGAQPAGIAVDGRYAYIADGGSNKMSILDISDPKVPVLVGTPISVGAGTAPGDIVVQGRYAYLSDGSAQSISVVDISDPNNPVLKSNPATTNGNPVSLTIQGRYLYVINAGNYLSIFDLASNPSNPTLVTTVAITGGGTGVDGLAISGDYLYIADYTNSKMTVMNISNPNSPSTVGTPITVGTNPFAITVAGRYAYTANKSGGNGTMSVIDISNPSSPVLLNTTSSGNTTAPYEIAISGKYAYIPDQYNSNLIVFDITGIETTAILAHSVEAGNMMVDTNAVIANGLNIGNALNVGQGGIYSNSDITTNGVYNDAYALTTGNAFNMSLTGLSTATNGLNISQAPAYTSTTGNSGNLMTLSRNLSNTTGTLTNSGALISITDNCSGAGTCTDTANLLSLTQSVSTASGPVLRIANSGTGSDIADSTNWSISKAGLITTASTATNALNFSGTNSAINFTTAGTINSTTGNIYLKPVAGGTVQIGAGGAGSGTPDVLGLDVKSSASGSADPSGANGEMYYNANLNVFRCYQNGAWANCIAAAGNPAWSAILAPTSNLSLQMNNYTTSFSYASSSTNNYNMFTLQDSAGGGSGTGYLYVLSTPAASNLKPLDIIAQGGQAFSINATGTVNIGSTAQATINSSGNLATSGTITQNYAPTTGTTNSITLSGQATSTTGFSLSQSPTYAGNITNSGNLISLSKSLTMNLGSNTLTDSGALISIADNCSGTGTCTDSANLVSLTESYASATNNIINISNSGTGNDIADATNWSITKTGFLTTFGTKSVLAATPAAANGYGVLNLGNATGSFAGNINGTEIAANMSTTIGDFIDFQITNGTTVSGAFDVDGYGDLISSSGYLGGNFTYISSSSSQPSLYLDTTYAWSGNANGTILGINFPSGFAGNLIDAQLNGTSQFSVNGVGNVTFIGHEIGSGSNLSGVTASTTVLGTNGGMAVTITGNNQRGLVSITNGTTGTWATGAVSTTFTFVSPAYASAPIIVISPASATAGAAMTALNIYASATSTGFNIYLGTAITSGNTSVCNPTACVFNYKIIQ